ncbi:hypothetical protein JYT61_00320 [bacterium AH-315-E10]|nr:hypothetical protein [bacterium AH-315-E10]
MIYRLLTISMLLLMVGCKSFDQTLYDAALINLTASSKTYMEDSQYPQAVIILRELTEAEPGNDEYRKWIDEAIKKDPRTERLVKRNMLGSNYSGRLKNPDLSNWGHVLLYIPNRVLDLLDFITLELGVCSGGGAEVHITKAISVGAQLTLGEAVVGIDRRHLSGRVTIENFVDILPFELRSMAEARAYTGGAYGMAYNDIGLKHPMDKPYQRARDYWGVGAQIQIIGIALKVELHPVELADFLAGWFLFDFLRDDLGTSKSVSMSSDDKVNLKSLRDQVQRRGPGDMPEGTLFEEQKADDKKGKDDKKPLDNEPKTDKDEKKEPAVQEL